MQVVILGVIDPYHIHRSLGHHGKVFQTGNFGVLQEELTYRRTRIDGWKVISEKSTAWVVKTAGNQVTAFGPQCTHLGCAYHWEDAKGEFLCPCHTSLFSIEGKVMSGPAPRPLDRYETKLNGSKLLLGKLRSPEKES